MTLNLALITIDSKDPITMGTFWAQVTGGALQKSGSGTYVMLADGQPGLAFQLVEEPTPGKNKLHLDFATNDIAAEQERLMGLGAQRLGEYGDAAFRWVQFSDPEGNVFDVAIEG